MIADAEGVPQPRRRGRGSRRAREGHGGPCLPFPNADHGWPGLRLKRESRLAIRTVQTPIARFRSGSAGCAVTFTIPKRGLRGRNTCPRTTQSQLRDRERGSRGSRPPIRELRGHASGGSRNADFAVAILVRGLRGHIFGMKTRITRFPTTDPRAARSRFRRIPKRGLRGGDACPQTTQSHLRDRERGSRGSRHGPAGCAVTLQASPETWITRFLESWTVVEIR